MKLLVTGSNGLVGSHFIENIDLNEGITLAPTQNELDITDQKQVKDFLKLNEPDTIIHFAAFTDVSLAEEQRNNKKASCWIVNVEGTANLIRAADPETYFIYISTDVVFSGREDDPGPYTEDHPIEKEPNFLSWYGWTKREAEKIIMDNFENAVILRIANPVRALYEPKLDYVRKILNLFDNGELYPLFNDQYLTLTYIDEVTETLRMLLKKRLTGIFHTSSTNIFTPYKLTSLLIEKTRGKKNVVTPISIEPFLKDNPSRYPKYGGLNVEISQNKLGLRYMRWEDIIEDLAKQL